MTSIATLDHRRVIAVDGEDRVSFLQGLVSQDMERAATGIALWSALLTPQGKWLAEFFVFSDGSRLLLDVEAAQQEMITTRLSRFKLRAKVAIAATPYAVQVAWGGPAPAVENGLIAADPRPDGASSPIPPWPRPPLPVIGMPTAFRLACRMGPATWRRKRPCCWKRASTS
jgi:folate-binding Fe-S cluster repair protein YgfZ